MYFRSNFILKYLVILLFVVEMLVPAWVSTLEETQPSAYIHQIQVTEQPASIDGISHILLEENNNEERVGRDFHFQPCISFDLFNSLEKFRSVDVKHRLTQVLFDPQPALFTLHRVVLI